METPSEFRTERFSRRGELTAWLLGIVSLLGWIALLARGLPVPLLYAFLTIFMLLSGVAISVSNWSDRRTLICLDADGVRFENGLRHVHMAWDEIQKVQIFSSNLGKQVRVSSERSFFTFRLFSEVALRGKVRGRVGFAQGELILSTILEKTKLNKIEEPGKGYYYARE
jgi:hypothetical protein